MYSLLDDCDSHYLNTHPVQSPHSLPALLQLPLRLLQVTGKAASCQFELSLISLPVLAATLNLHLLRTTLSRPPLSHLFPPTILPPARARVRTVSGDFLVATPICHYLPPRPKYLYDISAVPRLSALEHTRLHLVAAEPRHPTQLFGNIRLYSTMVTLGLDGI
jgi:hypothetical protein